MRRSVLMLLIVAGAGVACRTPSSPEGSAVLDGPAAELPLALESVDSEAVFAAASKPASGLVRSGRALKFFADIRNPEAPKLWFINGNFKVNGQTPEYAKYHYNFAKKHANVPEPLEEFNSVTYFTESKRYLAGTLHTYTFGEPEQTYYGVQFYPQDAIRGAKALTAAKLVSSKVGIPGARFAFVETGSQQSVADVIGEMESLGIERLTLEQILGQTKYIPMHLGEAWGYLRIFPANQDELSAADIPVFDELPLDLTVVAGVMTRAFQDTNSHINLKSKERNTPNAVLRDASPQHPDLAPFDGKPVHLVVSQEGYKIEPTTPAVIEQKLKERFNKPWIPLSWTPTTTLRSYDAMCPANAAADCLKQGKLYGGKNANLGFLAHKTVLGRKAVAGTMSNKLGYDLVPLGFGVPLQFYKSLVDYPANAALKAKITELIQKEKAAALTPAQRVALANEVQKLFFNAKFPPADLTKIKQKVQQDLAGIEKIKVRSSANAEDIENFDGAGLHDSYSAKPAEADNADQSCVREIEVDPEGGAEDAKMKPRSIGCAIKGVYASLWNKRAIEERSFARIDHASVSMAVSILPAYDYQAKIAANSVVVTRVINSNDVFGYSLSVQKKNNLVTNPDPGTFSETAVAALGFGNEPTTLTFTRFAKPKRDEPQLTAPVLTSAEMLQMVTIARRVEEAYCKAKPGYYPNACQYAPVDADKPKALDFEFKYLKNGQWVCKQVREFGGH